MFYLSHSKYQDEPAVIQGRITHDGQAGIDLGLIYESWEIVIDELELEKLAGVIAELREEIRRRNEVPL